MNTRYLNQIDCHCLIFGLEVRGNCYLLTHQQIGSYHWTTPENTQPQSTWININTKRRQLPSNARERCNQYSDRISTLALLAEFDCTINYRIYLLFCCMVGFTVECLRWRGQRCAESRRGFRTQMRCMVILTIKPALNFYHVNFLWQLREVARSATFCCLETTRNRPIWIPSISVGLLYQ